jgi:hypothetical protein
VDDPGKRKDPANRDATGRFGPNNAANPSGRPKALREYQEWLADNALEPAKKALLACLESEDGKVRMMAVKEVADRLFGKASQAITGPDGQPLVPVDVLAILSRFVKREP